VNLLRVSRSWVRGWYVSHLVAALAYSLAYACGVWLLIGTAHAQEVMTLSADDRMMFVAIGCAAMYALGVIVGRR
jgi:hypothetical protein